MHAGFDGGEANNRLKNRWKKDLSMSEMEQIIEEVKSNQFTIAEVACHFRVKRHIVDQLVRNETSGVNTLAKIAGDLAQ